LNKKRVQEALKENSTLVKDPPNLDAVSVTTNQTQFNTNALWKKVFSNSNTQSKE